MAYIGYKPADKVLTASDITDGIITKAKLADDYDDKIQSNIALLGFKTAVNGSLVKYNLQDQIIDEYEDASGIDASASTNERLNSGVYYGETTVTPSVTEDADDSGTDGDYTWYKWTDTASTGSYSTDTTQAHEVLVVAGGGSAGGSKSGSGSGAGGAGGYRTSSALSLVGSTSYTITVGAGGTATAAGNNQGVAGSNSSISGSDITDIESAGGGGGGHASGAAGTAGGSGGGGGGNAGVTGATGGAGNTPSTSPVQGYAGGTVTAATGYGCGGGGSSAVGANGSASAGGAGTANDITGASVTYAAGGSAGNNNPGADATANTGNGGQGGGQAYGGGAGGSGIVILRRTTSTTSAGADLTLQSTDTTAMAEPDYADMVILMENSDGTATINTDIKGYISKDSGSTFTEGTLVDEGTWGTNKKIYAFHDLDVSAQSGTSMCYKITTHNQSAGSKVTKIHATSIGWR